MGTGPGTPHTIHSVKKKTYMLWRKCCGDKKDRVRRSGAGRRFKWGGPGGLVKKVTFERALRRHEN